MRPQRRAPVALLLLDYQEAMCRPGGRVGGSGLGTAVEERGVLDHAATTLRAFRSRGLPVFHARMAFDDQYARMTSAAPRFTYFRSQRILLESARETAICAEVAPAPEEPVIDMGCANPFVGTRLQSLLVDAEIDHLLLGGVTTDQAVESTARLGSDLGYRISVLEDLCAASTPAVHDFSVTHALRSCGEVVTSNTAVTALDALGYC